MKPKIGIVFCGKRKTAYGREGRVKVDIASSLLSDAASRASSSRSSLPIAPPRMLVGGEVVAYHGRSCRRDATGA